MAGQLIWQEDGVKLLLGAEMNGPPAALTLRAQRAAFTNRKGLVLGDMTEANFNGYVKYLLAGWGSVTYVDPRAIILAPPQTWLKAAGGTGNNLYGWYLTDDPATKLYATFDEPSAPIDMNTNGATYVAAVKVTQKSEFPSAGLAVHDQFVDPNGTPITGHTIAPVNGIGAVWVAVTGTIDINANQATCVAAGATGAVAQFDSLQQYGRFDFTSPVPFAGVAWNIQNANNFAYCRLGGGAAYLREYIAGVDTARASVGTASMTVKVLYGNGWAVLLDGAGNNCSSSAFSPMLSSQVGLFFLAAPGAVSDFQWNQVIS